MPWWTYPIRCVMRCAPAGGSSLAPRRWSQPFTVAEGETGISAAFTGSSGSIRDPDRTRSVVIQERELPRVDPSRVIDVRVRGTPCPWTRADCAAEGAVEMRLIGEATRERDVGELLARRNHHDLRTLYSTLCHV